MFFWSQYRIPIATYDLVHIFGWTEYAHHAKLIENYLDSRMSEEEIDRKITVIFATDVVGYSKHMEADESGTVKNLRACEKILTGLFEKHKGVCLIQVEIPSSQSFPVRYRPLNVQ